MTVGEGLLGALAAELPSGCLVVDPDVIEAYRYDRASTVAAGSPVAVVRASSTADVQATLRVASRFATPVVTRGAGTGLSGGATAVDGSITLSTERMTAIEVDPIAMVAVARPGALNVDVKREAARHDLWYPPDPSSFEISTIGGNVATNAGGLCCVRYGVTGDYVLGLEVVLADGRALRLGGRTVKDVAGYDLKRLIVGSEGTLAVITEVTLRLQPPPPPTVTIVATFADAVDAGRAVVAVMARMRPSLLELMDGAAVAAVERVHRMGFDGGVGALLVAQCDAGAEPAAALSRCFEQAGATYVAATADPVEAEQLLAARRVAVPCVERLGHVLIEDVGVPVPQVPDLVAAVAAIAVRTGTLIPIIGHAGDGNLHPLVTFDATDADAAARAQEAFDSIMAAARSLGGTVTGEHGVGSLKARHLADQLGPDVLDVHRSIKAALDPQNLLNPGKWIDS